MSKRLFSFIFAAILLFTSNSSIAYACDERQTTTYLGQVLFGNNAARWASDDRMVMLADALYLCSEQSDGKGQDKLTFLKDHQVSGIPSISSIDITANQLLDCSHHSWAYVASSSAKSQSARKAILTNTVNSVFGTNIIDNTIGSLFGNAKKTKYQSFATLLFYLHILFDYLADDPDDTEVFVRGNLVSSYSGEPYVEVNGNVPTFPRSELSSTEPFQRYSQKDAMGRASVAYVNVCAEIMPPSGSRQQIGMITPSGWHQMRYPGLVNSSPPYLFNRCHLVAHQLNGNDKEINLITGTRFLNETGMKPFEKKVAAYVSTHSGSHVLYRATPVYNGNNLLASGVQLEAWSVEDQGEGICFNVYCYNVQPGVNIDYTNGTNEVADITYSTTNILPFAVYGANDSNPDLILEIDKQLSILFQDQSEPGTSYNDMQDQIKTVAIKARVNGNQAEGTAQQYQEMHTIKFEYFNILRAYLPILLSNEGFFTSVFH